MKAEFTLELNNNGHPIIKFKHHDKSNALEQQILKVFILMAQENGIRLNYTSGYIEMGTNNSWDYYEITVEKLPKNKKKTKTK